MESQMKRFTKEQGKKLFEELEAMDRIRKDDPKARDEIKKFFIGSRLRSAYMQGQIDLHTKEIKEIKSKRNHVSEGAAGGSGGGADRGGEGRTGTGAGIPTKEGTNAARE